MEESLKVVRLLHQLIIIVSATTLIFALSAEVPRNEYGDALNELRVVVQTLPDIPALRAEPLMQYYAQNGVVDVLRAEMVDANVTLAAPTDSFVDSFVEPSRNISRLPIEKVYQLFYTLPRQEEQSVWDIDLESLRDVVRNFRSKNLGPGNVVFVRFSPSHSDNSKVVVRIGNVGNDVPHHGSHNIIVKQPWQIAVNRGLVTSTKTGVDALPALRKVWETVRALDVGSAEPVLERKDHDARRENNTQLSVFGLTIRAQLAVIASPLILIALMFYLLAHLLHIQAITVDNEGILDKFPWIALFDTKISVILTYASLWFLPSVATAWLAIAATLDISTKLILGSIYFFAMTVIAMVVIAKIRSLVRHGHAPLIWHN